MQRVRTVSIVAGIAALAMLAACTDQAPAPTSPSTSAARGAAAARLDGAVYTMTNASTANAVVAFRRAADGSLTSLGTIATGGRGTGGAVDPLQSQYSVLLDDTHQTLFVVNAGSNDVSAFHVAGDGSLRRTALASSGGAMPVSLAQRGDLLYVLNAGDNSVSGLRTTPTGELIQIPHSTHPLSAGAAGASTIHFSADGSRLIVTERDANRIETLAVMPNGRLGAPVVTASHGATPFGFDVTPRNQPIITEAAGAAPDGAVSSYSVAANGALQAITGSLDAGGAATCWLRLTADGRLAFSVNSGSNAIALFSVGDDGTLTLANAQAAATGAGTAPLDLDLAAGGRFMYVLEGGSGNIATFDVGGSGTLSARGTIQAGAPSSGLQGLAAF